VLCYFSWLVSTLLFVSPSPPQQASPAPTSDPQAVAAIQQAAIAMGGSAPSDSTATGTITTVAGSPTENGTITILTRGTDQTSEQIQTPSRGTNMHMC
jgi:hypothetical protein